MKTIKLLLIAAIAIIATACSGSQAEQVNQKLTKGEPLTQDDWTVVINYLGNYAEKAQPIQDAIDNATSGSDESTRKAEELAQLTQDNPYLEAFNSALAKSTKEEVGAANAALVDKYASYIWFNSPSWATIQTDPNVQGMIEEMPATTDTAAAGVVAQGDGEAVK